MIHAKRCPLQLCVKMFESSFFIIILKENVLQGNTVEEQQISEEGKTERDGLKKLELHLIKAAEALKNANNEVCKFNFKSKF